MNTQKAPVVIKKDNIVRERKAFSGVKGDSGWWSRAIFPTYVDTKGIMVGESVINPGFPSHGWHDHTYDNKENEEMQVEIETKYPKKDNEYIFEEFYYIVSGKGIVQSETEDGKIMEQEVNAGDFVFFPRGVAKNQLFNNGTEKIFIIWGGTPVPEINVRPLKK